MERVSVTVTYLQMVVAPAGAPDALPAGADVRELRDVRPERYRDLYNGVGRAWHWTDRAWLSDEETIRLVRRPSVSVFVLQVDGNDAGFAELQQHADGSTEIVYFGLLPAYIGRRLSRPFLQHIIGQAWSRGDRVWLHTCSLDHPAALQLYLSAGFEPYREETRLQPLRSDAAVGP